MVIQKIYQCERCEPDYPCLLIVQSAEEEDLKMPQKCPFGWKPTWIKVELTEVER